MLTENTLEIVNPFVFLSYAKEDKPKVSRFYSRLKKDNLNPWIDDHYLFPGSDWDQVVRKTIRNCRFFIVFLSSNAINKRGYIQREIREALAVAEELPEDKVFIIPVRIETCEVPERLKKWQWIDMFKKGGYNKLCATIIQQLGPDYNPPSSRKLSRPSLPAPSFEKPEDYLLFNHFVGQNTFNYGILGAKRYGLSDNRILIIRTDLPNAFLELMPVLSHTQKISRKNMLQYIPSKKLYRKPGNELKNIEQIKPNVLRLRPKGRKFLVHINSLYWRFVLLYCNNPKTFLISPFQPVVVESSGRVKMIIMPIRY